jgi:hypothetical protein
MTGAGVMNDIYFAFIPVVFLACSTNGDLRRDLASSIPASRPTIALMMFSTRSAAG